METTWQKDWKSHTIYPSLLEDVKCDVTIVGGGISGITLAYLLSKAGKSVVVLEKGNLRDNSHTAYTTAMLMAEVDTSFKNLTEIFGKEKATMVWEAGLDALDVIEKIIREEGIECEFERVPAFIYANNEKEWQGIKEDMQLVKEAGVPLEITEGKENLKIPNSGYYELESQAKFHSLKYCEALRDAATKHGARFFENSEVKNIKGTKIVYTYTQKAKVISSWVVIATYDPFNKPKELFAKKGMYMTYMLELALPKNSLINGLYVDAENPYHYFRVDKLADKDRVIIGGADHRTEIKMDPEKNFAAIEEYANKLFGPNYKIVTKWRGGILETWDGLPFVGSYSSKYPNRFVITGFSGNGITYSTIASKILVDKILGQKNKYYKVFDPMRGYSLAAAYLKGKDYIEEFFHGAIKNMFKKME
jgi:glycine/D-amino acid oxidase-like deaminating enzyme